MNVIEEEHSVSFSDDMDVFLPSSTMTSLTTTTNISNCFCSCYSPLALKDDDDGTGQIPLEKVHSSRCCSVKKKNSTSNYNAAGVLNLPYRHVSLDKIPYQDQDGRHRNNRSTASPTPHHRSSSWNQILDKATIQLEESKEKLSAMKRRNDTSSGVEGTRGFTVRRGSSWSPGSATTSSPAAAVARTTRRRETSSSSSSEFLPPLLLRQYHHQVQQRLVTVTNTDPCSRTTSANSVAATVALSLPPPTNFALLLAGGGRGSRRRRIQTKSISPNLLQLGKDVDM